MIHNPRPTRAEATDVANAILDGSDCVMLSGETAKGAFPIHAVSMMASIAREAEADINYAELYPNLRRQISLPIGITEATAASAGTHPDLKPQLPKHHFFIRLVFPFSILDA